MHRDAPVEWLADPRVIEFYERVEHRPDVIGFHAMTASLASPPAGGSVLDVGCGVGATTACLGRLVGELGTVIGIDDVAPLIDAARRSATGPVRFELGSVSELPYPDDEFDHVRCSWAREGAEDADQVVRELVRVTRPGGHVVLVDGDAGSVAVDVADPAVVTEVLGAVRRTRHAQRSGFALRRRLVRAGCRDVQASPYTFTMASLADAAGLLAEFNEELPSRLPPELEGRRETWFKALREADRAGELLVSLTAWAAVGCKRG